MSKIRILGSTVLVFIIGSGILYSCKFEEIITHSVGFRFSHAVSENPITTNSFQYINEAGNTYSVENLKYVLSDFRIRRSDGKIYGADGFLYVDINNPSTMETPAIFYAEEGEYTAIGFILGLDEGLNIDGIHEDLNLLNWNWPQNLGGGYHYMQLEGKYLDDQQMESPFATHLGTAREIIPGEPEVFIPNYVIVQMDAPFNLTENSKLTVEMDIEKWFESPNTWDFNLWNTGIMSNFEAQTALSENGLDVFRFKEILADQ